MSIICFAILEISTRILFKDFSPTRDNEYIFFEYDSILGWKNKPLAEGDFKTPDGITHVKINSKGLRDKEYSYENKLNKSRVIFLGDSNVWGYGVSNSELFTTLLEDKFNNSIDIINMGVSGYSTDQEFLLLKEEGIKYSPDIVVLVFFSNDLGGGLLDYKSGYSKPVLLESNNGSYDLLNVPVPTSSSDWIERRVNPTDEKIFSFVKFFTSKSKFLYFLSKQVYDGSRNFLLRMGIAEENPSLDLNSKEWNNTLFIINLINDYSVENDIKLILVNFPSKTLIKSGKIHNHDSILNFFSESKNITFYSLINEVLAEDSKNNLYQKFDSHMNTAGHQYLADIFYEKLINMDILK